MSSVINRRQAAYNASMVAQQRWQVGRQFVARPGSTKVTCATCGRTGYDGTSHPLPWQITCLLGHAPAGCCGRMFTLSIDGTPRPNGHQAHVCRPS